MSDGDLSIEEKRVYGDRTGAREAYLASAVGAIRVSVSDDLVGGFGLAHRCVARDVAAGGGAVAVATDEGVALSTDGEEFDDVGFGPAAAVGLHESHVVAAGEDGRVARLDPVDGGLAWTDLGSVDEPRAVDGGLIAAADGVHRVEGDDLTHAGLSDVRDVAGRGVPLAATPEGLYVLGNGWMEVSREAFSVVESDGERAHAVGEAGVLTREDAGGDWEPLDLPTDGEVVGVAYGPGQVVAATREGAVLAWAGDDWRSQLVGARDVSAVALR